MICVRTSHLTVLVAAFWLGGCGAQLTRYEAQPGSIHNVFSYRVENESSEPWDKVTVSVDERSVPPWLRLHETSADLGDLGVSQSARARFHYDVAWNAPHGEAANLSIVVRAAGRMIREDQLTIASVREVPPTYYSH